MKELLFSFLFYPGAFFLFPVCVEQLWSFLLQVGHFVNIFHGELVMHMIFGRKVRKRVQ